jgi:hypothetical protein
LAVPHWLGRGSVSTPRSSNRTCRFPASGSRTRRHAFAHGSLRPWRSGVRGRNARRGARKERFAVEFKVDTTDPSDPFIELTHQTRDSREGDRVIRDPKRTPNLPRIRAAALGCRRNCGRRALRGSIVLPRSAGLKRFNRDGVRPRPAHSAVSSNSIMLRPPTMMAANRPRVCGRRRSMKKWAMPSFAL